ncbi:hypothetical protein Btru_046719 [Bulinus truncatus]|nr:hypothetical protein Btru_046719 [Bulinus truncatus]
MTGFTCRRSVALYLPVVEHDPVTAGYNLMSTVTFSVHPAGQDNLTRQQDTKKKVWSVGKDLNFNLWERHLYGPIMGATKALYASGCRVTKECIADNSFDEVLM